MLTTVLGKTVVYRVAGHSNLNGAPIPAGSTVTITNNDPCITIATVPPLAADSPGFDVPVTLNTEGTSDGHIVITDPTGVIYEATDTITIGPAPQPGLVRISAEFVEV